MSPSAAIPAIPIVDPSVESHREVGRAVALQHAPALRAPRSAWLGEARLRATGFGAISVAIWMAALRFDQRPLAWALLLALPTVAVLAVAARERDEHRSAAVRAARFAVAGLSLALAAPAALALFGAGADPLRVGFAGVVAVLYAALWDGLVCSAARTPLRLLVVGAGTPAVRLREAVDAQPRRAIEIVGFLRTDDAPGASPEALARPLLGRLADLERVVGDWQVDGIVLATPSGRLDVLERVLSLRTPPAVLELSDVYERALGRVPVREINAAWFLQALALSRRRAVVLPKRIVDVVIAGLGLVAAAPAMLAIAIAIRLDSDGPALYRQVRVGERGREFEMLKFRSMRTDAEADGAARFAAEDDPRVTRVGRVLRRCRLDELPQLWNVLRGEMTLVGPRPERPAIVEQLAELVPFYESRHLARPGVTGWAQVCAPYGASAEDALDKLSYDLYYLNHASLSTDFGIMIRTGRVMILGSGAR
jgi:exopolysaccharide biosynthesis polyprenyl glycosylphosphotransferase